MEIVDRSDSVTIRGVTVSCEPTTAEVYLDTQITYDEMCLKRFRELEDDLPMPREDDHGVWAFRGHHFETTTTFIRMFEAKERSRVPYAIFLSEMEQRNLNTDSIFKDSHTPMSFQCGCEHNQKFVTTMDALSRIEGTCPKCFRKDQKQEAKDRLQKTVSPLNFDVETYRGAKGRVTLTCSEGHSWDTYPQSVRKGVVCPVCTPSQAPTQKSSEEARELLEAIAWEKGMALQQYNGAVKPSVMSCALRHRTEMYPKSIRAGMGCSVCEGEPMREAAATFTYNMVYGGLNHVEPFTSRTKQYTIRCDNQFHAYMATPGQVARHKGCQACLTDEANHKVQEYVDQWDGIILSPVTVNAGKCGKFVTVTCPKDHEWRVSANLLLSNESSCPECTSLEGTSNLSVATQRLDRDMTAYEHVTHRRIKVQVGDVWREVTTHRIAKNSVPNTDHDINWMKGINYG